MSNDFANDADYTAVIDSLQNTINNQAEAWIGIEDTSDDNTANNWIFSSSGDAVTRTNWRAGNNPQPANGNGRCVFLKANREDWFNAVCDDPNDVRNFICEF